MFDLIITMWSKLLHLCTNSEDFEINQPLYSYSTPVFIQEVNNYTNISIKRSCIYIDQPKIIHMHCKRKLEGIHQLKKWVYLLHIQI